MINPELSSNSSTHSSDLIRPDSSQDMHTDPAQDDPPVQGPRSGTRPFTATHQKTPFAIQELLGLSDRPEHEERHSATPGGDEAIKNLASGFPAAAAAISGYGGESMASQAARNFMNSFSDQYNAGRLPYFNSGLFSNLQSQAAAAAAASSAGQFPASMSPNSAQNNMSHLLQVESSLRNEHPMHGKSFFFN